LVCGLSGHRAGYVLRLRSVEVRFKVRQGAVGSPCCLPGSARGQTAAAVGKKSVHVWQSERYIHFVRRACSTLPTRLFNLSGRDVQFWAMYSAEFIVCSLTGYGQARILRSMSDDVRLEVRIFFRAVPVGSQRRRWAKAPCTRVSPSGIYISFSRVLGVVGGYLQSGLKTCLDYFSIFFPKFTDAGLLSGYDTLHHRCAPK